jgi:hypothetical protein
MLMARYAIKTVPMGWHETLPLPFNQTTRAFGKVEAGMHILIFQHDVGIVADGMVQAVFTSPQEWAACPLPASFTSADFLLPLEALYYRGKIVSPEAVRQILGDPSFPQLDGWRPIDALIHQQFIRRLL